MDVRDAWEINRAHCTVPRQLRRVRLTVNRGEEGVDARLRL
jgi:hypothetical protein